MSASHSNARTYTPSTRTIRSPSSTSLCFVLNKLATSVALEDVKVRLCSRSVRSPTSLWCAGAGRGRAAHGRPASLLERVNGPLLVISISPALDMLLLPKCEAEVVGDDSGPTIVMRRIAICCERSTRRFRLRHKRSASINTMTTTHRAPMVPATAAIVFERV